MRVFECTSIQRQFRDKMGSKCNSNSIVIVNYIINNRNHKGGTVAIIGIRIQIMGTFYLWQLETKYDGIPNGYK